MGILRKSSQETLAFSSFPLARTHVCFDTVSATQGKDAKTNYKLLKNFQFLSLLELKLNTGRTHQIRVHLNHINMPVFGDPVYNGRKSQLRRLPSHLQKRGAALLKKINRQALHAKELSFIHPKTNEGVSFSTKLPQDMRSILNNLEDVLFLNLDSIKN